MAGVEKSVEVRVPVSTAYNQWTQFEDFPRFMEGVQEVKQLDDRILYWRAEIAGQEREWHARILEQIPDQRIEWISEEGARNAGEVTFEPVWGGATLVTLRIEYVPKGIVETVGDKLGIVSRRVERDLNHFKDFLESRGVETGAWRGTIGGRDN
jgi:uncharacterized membrane protein